MGEVGQGVAQDDRLEIGAGRADLLIAAGRAHQQHHRVLRALGNGARLQPIHLHQSPHHLACIHISTLLLQFCKPEDKWPHSKSAATSAAPPPRLYPITILEEYIHGVGP